MICVPPPAEIGKYLGHPQIYFITNIVENNVLKTGFNLSYLALEMMHEDLHYV